jgi:hypothetical protein
MQYKNFRICKKVKKKAKCVKKKKKDNDEPVFSAGNIYFLSMCLFYGA